MWLHRLQWRFPGFPRRGASASEYGEKLLLPAATKLGQGNIFTPVCDSVNRGGVVWSRGSLIFWGEGVWSRGVSNFSHLTYRGGGGLIPGGSGPGCGVWSWGVSGPGGSLIFQGGSGPRGSLIFHIWHTGGWWSGPRGVWSWGGVWSQGGVWSWGIVSDFGGSLDFLGGVWSRGVSDFLVGPLFFWGAPIFLGSWGGVLIQNFLIQIF